MTAALNWYRANFTGDVRDEDELPPVEIHTTLVWSDNNSALGRDEPT